MVRHHSLYTSSISLCRRFWISGYLAMKPMNHSVVRFVVSMPAAHSKAMDKHNTFSFKSTSLVCHLLVVGALCPANLNGHISSNFNYCNTFTLALRHYYIIITSSLHYLQVLTALSVRPHCIISRSSLHYQQVITALSVGPHCVINRSSLHYQYVITALSVGPNFIISQVLTALSVGPNFIINRSSLHYQWVLTSLSVRSSLHYQLGPHCIISMS